MLRVVLIPLVMALIASYAITRFTLWKTRQELTSGSRPLTHPAVVAEAGRLAAALGLDRVSVLELRRDEVNGMADADGRVFLTSGFVRKHEAGEVTAAELASVIAHELGHVSQGHVKKRMREVMGHQTALMMSNIFLARFLPFVGPWLASRVAQALMAKTSREHEFQADAWASALLIKAGVGTGPQKSLFRKLDRLTNGAGGTVPAWLRSHPTTAERIAAIEANEARWLG